MHPRFVAGECHFSWRDFEREMIAEVDLMFLRQGCTEAKNRKQELTGKEVAKKIAKKTERASAGEGGETVLNNAVNYS